MDQLIITIMAGGLGKRMNSQIPKVLQKVDGKPMIVRLIEQVFYLSPKKIIIVVGKFFELIKHEIEKYFISEIIVYAIQEIPQGTGDAIKSTLPVISDLSGYNLILNGDVPLLKYDTIYEICNYGTFINTDLMITCIELQNPTGNGRIITTGNTELDSFWNGVSSIVEEKDCTELEKKIKLVNCGIYFCKIDGLKKYIPLIDNNNAQQEYYLTDIVKLHRNDNLHVELFLLPSEKEIEIYNINTSSQLEFINKKFIH